MTIPADLDEFARLADQPTEGNLWTSLTRAPAEAVADTLRARGLDAQVEVYDPNPPNMPADFALQVHYLVRVRLGPTLTAIRAELGLDPDPVDEPATVAAAVTEARRWWAAKDAALRIARRKFFDE